jgi:hypothetical protein
MNRDENTGDICKNKGQVLSYGKNRKRQGNDRPVCSDVCAELSGCTDTG